MRNIDTNKLIENYLYGNVDPKSLEQLRLQYDSNRAWRKFKKRIPGRKSHTVNIWKYAGAAALLVVAVVFSHILGTKQIQDNFADIVVDVPEGARLNMSLPDGSTVYLNGGTRISYSQGFGISDRNMRIDGEGYFEVARNENLPMRLVSKSLSVEVLGTKFSFKDYEGENNASVALAQGSVRVSAGEDSHILKPGQSAVLNHDSGSVTIFDDRNDNLLAWHNGCFSFEHETLGAIAQQLSHAYGISFVFASDDLRALSFFASFSNPDITPEEVLSRLSATQAFHYEINGKTVLIKK